MTLPLPLTVWIHLAGEIPRIGHGLRRVEILAIGRKWVRLKRPLALRAVRVHKTIWDRVLAHSANDKLRMELLHNDRFDPSTRIMFPV